MNKNKNLFVFFTLMFIGIQTYSQEKQVSVCDSFSVVKNKVVFNCNDNAKISLEFLDSKNIKFWFSPNGDFKRNNESFAVVNEIFDNSIAITVQDSNSAFEIFTGDLRVRVSKSPFNISIFDKYQKLIMGDFNQEAYSYQDSNAITKKVLRQDEHIFGLGEKSGSLDRRGKTYMMWNSDKPCYSETEDPLYKSIPFFMSSYNYGIFFDNTYKTAFDFGNTSQEYFSFSTPNGPFIYYFMFGNDYKEIIGSYTKLTGKPIMPPKWALGWSQSRGLLTNEKLTMEIATEYREKNIPIDIIYQDIGWTQQLQDFNWNPKAYENPKPMLDNLADMGFKIIVSQDPVVSKGNSADWYTGNLPNQFTQWKEADSLGYFTTDNRTGKTYDMPWPWGGNCGVVDFTNPDVADWWGMLQQKPIDDGVKGFWTDMGEPAWSNEESTDRLHMKHYLGMHDEIHNVYGLTWDKVVTEQFEKHNPNQRVFQMTRAAYAGMQRYTFGWSGDSGNGRDVLDGWDNLANQIPLGLSAGMGLVPFWTTDISGYCGEITDYKEFAELYIRWLQFGVFNPLSRAHHEGNNAVEPWLFGEEAEKIAKKSIEFKYQLNPYIYTYARQAYDKGIPIMRAMILEYSNDEEAPSLDHQFMFGAELLVAPVVKKGNTTKRVYLPKGNWIDYNNPQQVYIGKQYIDYNAPLDVTPIFVKEGAIIPMMPVMPYIGAMKNAPMILEIFPALDKSSSFELYEDDGETNNYKEDKFIKTTIESKSSSSEIIIIIHKSENLNFDDLEKRNYWLKVHIDKKPKKVLLNNENAEKYSLSKLNENWNTEFNESGYYHDKNLNILYIRFGDDKKEKTILIKK